jgi:hypothetical protein
MDLIAAAMIFRVRGFMRGAMSRGVAAMNYYITPQRFPCDLGSWSFLCGFHLGA